jgi:hypothetical protein
LLLNEPSTTWSFPAISPLKSFPPNFSGIVLSASARLRASMPARWKKFVSMVRLKGRNRNATIRQPGPESIAGN